MAASYMKQAFDTVLLRRIALETYRIMQEVDAEIVVARGLSGIVIVTSMAALFNTPFAIVRKANEQRHSTNLVEISGSEYQKYTNWIVVDDFISSGETMHEIAYAMERELTRDDQAYQAYLCGVCKGIVLYGYRRDDYKHWNGVPVFPVKVADNKD